MITEVAIKTQDGIVWRLSKPNRHYNVIHLIYDSGKYTDQIKGEQGFIYNDQFVDRITAGEIAIKIGQIDKLQWPPKLFSEDLW